MSEQSWVEAMSDYLRDDQPRIDHILRVLRFAEAIMDGEGVSERLDKVVTAAAIFHDIGIKEAKRKHGSPDWRFQEIEGPSIAREILQALGEDEGFIERVCYIVGNHHSADKVNGLDFRIVWEADWLVNLKKVAQGADADRLKTLIDENFRTRTGTALAEKVYLAGATSHR